MAVITISRDFASLGDQIAKAIAEKLNYRLVDKDLIEEVLIRYGLVAFDEVYSSEQGLWSRFDSEKNRIVKMLNNTIRGFALLDNCVIVGRGAFAVLQGYDNVINVSIRLPFDLRVANIRKEKEFDSLLAAEEFVSHQDRVRSGFLQTFYDLQEDNLAAFDLSFNLRLVETEDIVKWVAEIANKCCERAIEPEKDITAIEKDKILQNAIAEVIGLD